MKLFARESNRHRKQQQSDFDASESKKRMDTVEYQLNEKIFIILMGLIKKTEKSILSIFNCSGSS